MVNDNYTEQVLRAARNMDGELLYNRSVGHASILIKNLLAVAEKEICIISADLDPRAFWKEEAEVLTRFLNRNSSNSVQIIVENITEQEAWTVTFLRYLEDGVNDMVQVRVASAKVQEGYNFNMCIVDGKHYRFELDREKPEAVAAFGNINDAISFQDAFNVLWERCALANSEDRSSA